MLCAVASREDGSALGGGEFAPRAGGEIAEGELADAGAEEAERGVADGGGHAADLAVFSFDEFEGEPGVGDGFSHADGRDARSDGGSGIEQARAAGQGAVVVDRDAAARETGEGIGGRGAFNLRPVFAAMGVAGIEQPGVEARFVAEEQQALAVGVEAAERIDAGGQAEIGERSPTRAGLGRELREDAVGFVEREQHGTIGMRR
jgi:hypothetical protein